MTIKKKKKKSKMHERHGSVNKNLKTDGVLGETKSFTNHKDVSYYRWNSRNFKTTWLIIDIKRMDVVPLKQRKWGKLLKNKKRNNEIFVLQISY